MKNHALLFLAIAAVLLPACKSQSAPEPNAIDVIMTRTSIRSFTGESVPKEQLETILRAGMAAENILLAAHALGLGAVWTAAYPAMERAEPIAQALGLPEDVLPLCVIPVGIPAENPEPKDKWNPDNIHWEKW